VIERCLQEQRECLAALAAGHEDVRGLVQGIEDWVMEEVLELLRDGD
jgi:hypothetical protein